MPMVGANGKTLQEMLQSLQLPTGMKQGELAKQIESFIGHCKSNILKIVNSAFLEKSYPIEEAFIDILENSWGLKAQNVDFYHQPEQTRKDINAMVKTQTAGLIDELLPKESITHYTRFVLVNAIYFKGQWEYEFLKQHTDTALFTLLDSKKVKVDMMQLYYTSIPYGSNKIMQWIQLPYKGQEFQLTICLPNIKSTTETLSSTLKYLMNPESMDELHKVKDVMFEIIALPRFEINFGTSAKQIFQKLGMQLAFEKEAEFFGICKKEEQGKGLHISEIFHKAVIKVDEQGTEASAATAVVGEDESECDDEEQQMLKFICDRPFLFILEHVKTKTVMFMGQLVDPLAK